MNFECPGAKKIKYPEPRVLRCPFCGTEVEIWTDEIKTVCPDCKNEVFYPKKDLNCLEWCKYAKECVGEKRYKKLQGYLVK